MQFRAMAVVILSCTWCVGCATQSSHADLSAFLKAHEHTVSATESRLEPGDGIGISAMKVFEIDGEMRTVQPDGKISLDLLGEVKVAGLTARETAAKLEELLAPYYTDPQVRVQILRQPGRVFYVLGQVGGRGPVPYTGRDTLMNVLARAQPNHIAWKSRIRVIRPSPVEGERREITVNLNAMIKEGDTRQNILLEPGDVVYVPPTPLGWVGLRVRELIQPAVPVLQAYQTPEQFFAAQDEYNVRRQGTSGG